MGHDVTSPDVRIFDDSRELARAAAEAVAAELAAAVTRRGRAFFALAGGSTPQALYEELGHTQSRYAWWSAVEFLFGDERCVPPDDPQSNYHAARTSLLDPLGATPERIHRIWGELDPAVAAARYEEELRGLLPADPPRLDLVLLGLGEDGHTASLFPGQDALEERDRWVVATVGPKPPPHRVTLTFALLNQTRAAYFLATGTTKAASVAAVLDATHAPPLPAARVRPRSGAALWWLDRAAAAQSSMAAAQSPMPIHKEILIEELVERLPSAVGFLRTKNIRCIACGEPIWGTLEEAAREKGCSPAEIESLVAELNALASRSR
jgi:6-phosphogluconolactonase